ncbi:hypothetical protein EV383_4380 [Pseudonocardia sediminis]|uniref:Uncharacterized protein n=1 Tax=Pseudonocardia sediminis TaxID=1397368 RepID=A0A4Q7UZN0_PSEST|nr:hypothetical protein [Pseudonocardia sediminis]RZT87456.1 hypothetical protein EV383_4380 [Pseudonocardia sediminis]
MLDRRSDSYLRWAKLRDVEVYEAAAEAGLLQTKQHRPETFEMGEQTQILAALFQLLQQNIHVTSGSRKKSRAKPWPTPETAADIVKRRAAHQAFDQLMEELVFVPQEEFDAHIAEHESKQAIIRNNLGSIEVSPGE